MTATLSYDDLAKWWSYTHGGGEDAHQAARLALVEFQPTSTLKAGGVIREAVRQHTADTAFPVRVPASTWRKARAGTASLTTIAEINAATSARADLEDHHRGTAPDGFADVENRLTVSQLLATLPPSDRSRIVKWFGLDGSGHKRVSGKDFYTKASLLAALRITANTPAARPYSAPESL